MSRTSANLFLLFAGLVWGGGFIAQETAMDDIGPFLFIGVRFVLAALAVLPLALYEHGRHSRQRPLQKIDWPPILSVSVIFFAAMMLQQLGLITTSVTNAGILTGLYVVLVPLIAFFFLRESQPFVVWPAAFVAFIGIWLLGNGGVGQLTWGDWLVIVSAVFAALHVIYVGKTVTGNGRPVAFATAQFATTGLLGLMGFGIARSLDWHYEPGFDLSLLIAAGPEILYASLIAGALAFTIMAVCQQYTSAADAAILMSSESLFAAIGGAILLGERLNMLGYLGCALMLIAIVSVSFASAKRQEALPM